VASIDLANLYSGLGVAILLLGFAVLAATYRWAGGVNAVVASVWSRPRDFPVDVREAQWSSTFYGNRVALNVVIEVQVTNRSDGPWYLASAFLRGHRALAVSIRQLAPLPDAGSEGRSAVPPGDTARLSIHFILDANPPADPAAPLAARLVLVDQHVRENALRLVVHGPKG
jgi:hypothetical protein